jgi:dihydrodipicolinate synthase/N-acetylneuraminate lyase
MQGQLAPLISALVRDINPATINLALSLPRSVVSPDLRLPLVASSSGTAAAVAKALAAILDWMSGASGLEPEPLSCAA